MKRKIPIVPLALVLAATLSAVLYWQLSKQAASLDRPPGGSATIEGTEVGVVSRLGARIASIAVEEGDRVERGQILVTLVCDEPETARAQAVAQVEAARAGLRGAEAQVELARYGVVASQKQADAAAATAKASASQRGPVSVKADLAKRLAGRVETLAAEGGATEQDLDRAQAEALALKQQLGSLGVATRAAQSQADAVGSGVHAAELQVALASAQVEVMKRQVAVAEAAVARAEVAVGECTLVAPRNGVVEVRAFEPGELAVPGARLLTLVDLDEVWATFYLASADLAAATVGARAVVRADALPGTTFEASVKRIGSQAEFTPRNVQTREDRDRLVYAVVVTIPNVDGKLRPGMSVGVELAAAGVTAGQGAKAAPHGAGTSGGVTP